MTPGQRASEVGRTRVRFASVALLAAIATLLVGCGSDGSAPAGDVTNSVTPTVGGPSPTGAVPSGEMDDLERPVAAALSKQVRNLGLTLDFLDCPDWKGKTPARLDCTGWFDSVPGNVLVKLTRADGTVGFDARLTSGVIATSRLVDQLETEGYTDVDCGARPAYPAEPGVRIVCEVTRDGTSRYVVGTATHSDGQLSISGWTGTGNQQ